MGDYRVIDSDGHVEPGIVADWTKYIEGPLGRTADQAVKTWGFQASGGSSTRRGSWDPAARLEDMDEEGIDTSVLFGSTIGLFPYQVTGSGRENESPDGLAQAVARGYNNWLHDYCSQAPDRLKAIAFVPFDTIEDACQESRRAVAELGAVGILMHPLMIESIGEMALDDPYFYPFFEEAETLDAPVLVHAGHPFGSFIHRRYPVHFRRHAINFPLSEMLASMDAICGGLLERFKKLRLGFFEGSVGWMPWWLDRLDEHFEKLPHQAPFIEDKPSRLLRKYLQEGRVFWSCEPDEKYLPFAIQEFGEDFVVYASDYPHWDCEFPESADLIARREELSDTAKRKIFEDNPKRLYGDRL
jgi:predicted TIM-barrel fold metal-dependent hydrolase